MAGYDDIIGFLIHIARWGVATICVIGGTYFMYKGFYFTTAEVTKVALGIGSPIGLVLTGAALVGAGVWLAYIQITKN
jgi:hypothetical protein